MDQQQAQLEHLSEIRSLMERSSRFISLSGLSGITAGLSALAGAGWAYIRLNNLDRGQYDVLDLNLNTLTEMVLIAIIVLLFAIIMGIFFTTRNAKKHGQKIWDNLTKRLLINLMIPLVTGGLFCLVLLYHAILGLVAPATLVFYGIALINASKYTLNDIRYLGFCEICLGLISALFMGYGLLFWALGFGVLHIVYGTLMYFKYER